MNEYLDRVSATARNAVYRRDWATVDACAKEILRRDNKSPEGYFLSGLVEKTSGRPEAATQAFATALELDTDRYDAAIELANQHCAARRNGDAAALVRDYEDKLSNSPFYLNMAGSVYSGIGLPERAWPLYQRANELQPGVDLFLSNLATCNVFLGKIDEAEATFRQLLKRFPTHQRYHYQLAQLKKATSHKHVEEMKEVIASTKMPPDKNVFMYYAIGKELEDLEQWDEAFKYFKMAGDAVASVANYDIETDLKLIDTIIDVCDAEWLQHNANETLDDVAEKTPIFVVGLPRTGTTLTERIIASHSKVRSVGESQFMQMVIRRESGIVSDQKMTPEMISAAARLDIGIIGNGYMEMLDYKLGNEAFFVDKLPFNIFYLGFIAKAFPKARIVLVKRNPMDSCFAMYKQVFTWAYKFSYTLDGLGRFYPAYNKLLNHWLATIGDRIIEVEYEELVSDQENQTRILLDRLGLDFEEACLNFDQNTTATFTASAVQVREKIHSRSVDRWRNFAEHLQPLKESLESAGIAID
jgi:tetratricopeptide (TPR) repeat protein